MESNQKCEKIVYVLIVWIMGILSHGYIMFNNYPTFSGYTTLYGKAQVYINQNRWVTALVTKLNGSYTLPWVIGIECIFVLAVSSYFLTDMFKICDCYVKILFAIVLCTSPVLYSSFVYLYMADSYMYALLFSILSVYFYYKRQKWIEKCLLFVLFTVLTLGTYQVYLSFSIMLIGIYMIFIYMDSRNLYKCIIDAVVCFALVCVSFIVNSIICFIVRKITCVELMYETVYPSSIIALLRLIKRSYAVFFDFVVNKSIYSNSLIKTMVMCLVVFTVGLYLSDNNTRYGDVIYRLLRIIIFIIISPVVVAGFYAITYRDYLCTRMWVGIISFFIIPCILIDKKCLDIKTKKYKYIKNAMVVMILIISWYQIVKGNELYLNMQMAYEKDYSLINRIVDRVEQFPYYNSDEPVYVIGNLNDKFSNKDYIYKEYISDIDSVSDYSVGDVDTMNVFCENNIQTDVKFCKVNEDQINKDILADIDEFPAYNCLKYLDGKIYLLINKN